MRTLDISIEGFNRRSLSGIRVITGTLEIFIVITGTLEIFKGM